MSFQLANLMVLNICPNQEEDGNQITGTNVQTLASASKVQLVPPWANASPFTGERLPWLLGVHDNFRHSSLFARLPAMLRMTSR